MNIGFIGLGKMGLPMAKNIIHSGFATRVYNRSAEKAEPLRALGAQVSLEAPGAVKEADVVITMLSDDNAVMSVSEEILPFMKKGSIHVSMSTIAPATAGKLAKDSARQGIHYLASPVMGRPPAADARQLFILLSGEDNAAKEKVRPVLQVMGQRVFDYGSSPGTANTVKLLMNYMIFVTTEMLSEAMLAAEKTGIDKQSLLDTMTSTIFGAPVINTYGTLVTQEKDNPGGFTTQLASKDLRLMLETASNHHLSLALGNVVQKNFKQIIASGQGDKDVSLLIAHLRKLNGK